MGEIMRNQTMKIISTFWGVLGLVGITKADFYEDHYDYMQGVVTGVVADTVNTVTFQQTNLDGYAASQDGLEMGKQIAPIVQGLVVGETTLLTIGQRVKRLETITTNHERIMIDTFNRLQ
jgi:hypothetical protein